MQSIYKLFFIACGIALSIVVPIVIFILRFMRIKNREKADQIFVNPTKGARRDKIYSLYKFFRKFYPTKAFIHTVSRRYEILYPGQTREVAKRTVRYAFIIWGISLLILYAIFVGRPTIYNAGVTLFLMWIVNSKLVTFLSGQGKKKLDTQMKELLDDIRHTFQLRGCVEEAIQEAADKADKLIKIHANKIHEILTSEHMQEEVNKYNNSTNINFLKILLAECVAVVNYGDKEVKGESLFIFNLRNLKIDISTDIRKINLIQFLFFGVSLSVVIPVVSLDFIRRFGIYTIPSLYTFYYGKNGIIAMTVIFALAIVMYEIMEYLEENPSIEIKNYKYLDQISNIKPLKMALGNYTTKHYGKMLKLKEDLKRMGTNITPRQLLVKRILFFFVTAAFGTCLFISLHSVNRYNIVNHMDNLDQLVSTVDDTEDNLEALMTKVINQWKDKNNVVEKDIETELSKKLREKNTITNVAGEIVKRVYEYQNEYFKWYEMIFILIASCIAYYYPLWMIRFRKSIIKMNMNDEVIQFQSIILMLMYIDKMTVVEVLKFMEAFAVIFKESIRTCINEYDAGDQQALINLKNKESFKPFQRLVEDFLISDKTGMERAFDEVAVDRMNSIEDRNLDNEIHATTRSSIAQTIGFLFFFGVLVLYFVLPFVVACMRLFNEYNQGLQGM